MDEKEYRHFQKELVRDPTLGPASRGTSDLMRLFGGSTTPRRPVTVKGGQTPVPPGAKKV